MTQADASACHLEDADLRDADLSESQFIRARLDRAKVLGSRLTGAKLYEATLIGADLTMSDLSACDLSESDLMDANLTDANLTGANLRRARLIRCVLSECIIRDVEVTDCQVQDTIGRPDEPNRLRVDGSPPLTGEDARNFFNPPAIVEVYLTELLTDEELAAFRFHMGDMRRQRVGVGVHLTGEREECGGTVLRFQGPSYAEVYDALPLLLKPFRMSGAVDWTKTYEALSQDDRGAVLTAIAKLEAQDSEGRWVFAHRMAELSHRFFDAKIRQIREGRRQGVVIRIATNQVVESELLQQRRRRTATRLEVTYHEDNSVTTEVNAKGNIVGSAIGSENTVTTGNINFQQLWNESSGSIDLARLSEELDQLRSAMRQAASEVEHDEAVGAVASAEKAAKQGDGPSALQFLKAAGKWAWDTANKIGAAVAVEAIKRAMGPGS